MTDTRISPIGRISRLRARWVYWVSAFLLTTAVGAACWVKSKERFIHTVSVVEVPGEGAHEIMVLRPASTAKSPVVVVLRRRNIDPTKPGISLNYVAQLGLATISVELNGEDDAVFDNLFVALSSYLDRQPWAAGHEIAWVGIGSGGKELIASLLQHPKLRPRLAVCAAIWDPLSSAAPNDRPKGGGNGIAHDAGAPGSTVPRGQQILLVDSKVYESDNRALSGQLRAQGMAVASTTLALPGGAEIDWESPLVLHLIGEHCRAVLAPGLLAPAGSVPLWIYLVPAWLVAIGWLALWSPVWWALMFGGPSKPVDRTLCWLARGVAALAIVQTMAVLTLPLLPVSKSTLTMARWWLVPAQYSENISWLVSGGHSTETLSGKDTPLISSAWEGQPLRELLDQAELADYNRTLVNWWVSDDYYRSYVLSPVIDPGRVQDVGWLRSLWEYFYPRIRKLRTPEEAAETVVRELRTRVTIAPEANGALGISAMWQRRIVDERGFQVLYAAALRSVGIPARLTKSGTVELWDGSRWLSAPQPVVSLLDGKGQQTSGNE